MFYGKLDLKDSYAPLLAHPVWAEAIGWLHALPADLAPGIHPLRGEQMFANVHGYETRAHELCRYESHRRYIDLQFCIKGGEIIEWHPTSALEPTGDYDAVKDVIHYGSPTVPDALLRMGPRSFAIFFPSDGHMPKVVNQRDQRVDKLVIKIDRDLVS